jgi:hypothetical protein
MTSLSVSFFMPASLSELDLSVSSTTASSAPASPAQKAEMNFQSKHWRPIHADWIAQKTGSTGRTRESAGGQISCHIR